MELDMTYIAEDQHHDPLGVFTVWSPVESEEKPITCDLVAVYGLTASSLSTWRHSNGTNMLDLLHDDFPGMRILTFSHQLKYAYQEEGNLVSGRIWMIGEQLCNDLSDLRRDVTRPMIFICHGVGGIIVKRALTHANERGSHYANLLHDTSHIVFIDTPHKGFDISGWQALSGDMFSAVGREQFERWSQSLNEIESSFAGIGSGLTITSFYADFPTTTASGDSYRPIHECSTQLHLPLERQVQLEGTNHFTICKFFGKQDHNYVRLLRRIRAVLSRTLLGFYEALRACRTLTKSIPDMILVNTPDEIKALHNELEDLGLFLESVWKQKDRERFLRRPGMNLSALLEANTALNALALLMKAYRQGKAARQNVQVIRKAVALKDDVLHAKLKLKKAWADTFVGREMPIPELSITEVREYGAFSASTPVIYRSNIREWRVKLQLDKSEELGRLSPYTLQGICTSGAVRLSFAPSNAPCTCNPGSRPQNSGSSIYHRFISAVMRGYNVHTTDCFHEKSCRRFKSAQKPVTFYFPAWFLRLISISNRPVSSNLSVPDVLPSNHKILYCCEKNDVDGIKEMFQRRQAKPNVTFEDDGFSLLHWAISYGHKETLKFLLQPEYASVSIVDGYGRPANEYAWYIILSRQLSEDKLDYLAKVFGLDDEWIERQDFSNLHLLVLGLKEGDIEEEVQNESAINSVDIRNKTPLSWAINRRNMSAARLLLQHDADVNIRTHNLVGPLLIAAEADDEDLFNLLIERGADVNAVDEDAYAPLHWVYDPSWAVSLLNAGAHVDALSVYGESPLYLAIGRSSELAATLIHRGANLQGQFGLLALIAAIDNRDHDILRLLLGKGANFLGTLSNNGISLQNTNTLWKPNYGATILHYLAYCADITTLGIFGENMTLTEVDFRNKDSGGYTAHDVLHLREALSPVFAQRFQELIGATFDSAANHEVD